MADKSKEGVNLPPYRFEVDRVKIRELMDAIGDDNPIYRDREAAVAEGFRDTPCPPTYFTLAVQEFTGAYFRAFEAVGVSLASLLHGEEEYEYLQEVYPGDVLSCQMSVESIVEKLTKAGPMNLISLRTCFTNQRGEEVVRARSLIVERK